LPARPMDPHRAPDLPSLTGTDQQDCAHMYAANPPAGSPARVSPPAGGRRHIWMRGKGGLDAARPTARQVAMRAAPMLGGDKSKGRSIRC